MGNYEQPLTQLVNGQVKRLTYPEVRGLLRHLGFVEEQKGRTSGSRVQFIKEGRAIILYRPHPQRDLKDYQLRQIAARLREWGQENEQ